jgi:hypothetical protein
VDPPGGPGCSVRVDAGENVFSNYNVLSFGQDHGTPTNTGAEAEALLKRLIDWREQRNAYAVECFLYLGKRLGNRGVAIEQTQERNKLKAWEDFWGIGDTGSLQGAVEFQGGDVIKKAQQSPAALVPADFRLAEGSIGKGARADGKDLGADVDLVGPGPAYEKWKKAPEYQQWLKETGQL